jgi:large subunit ribosomal protein L21
MDVLRPFDRFGRASIEWLPSLPTRQVSLCLEEAVYAVVRTGGKQYRVEEGRAVKVDRLPGEPGDTVELGDVLLMGEGDEITIGAPTIDGARVLGTIAEQGRADKIIVFRYKPKTRSRKKTGHRQHFTKVVVDDILAAGQQPKPKAAVAAPVEETPAAAPKKRGRRKPAADEETAATPEVAPDATEATGEAPTDQPEAAAEEAPAAKPKRTRRKTE